MSRVTLCTLMMLAFGPALGSAADEPAAAAKPASAVKPAIAAKAAAPANTLSPSKLSAETIVDKNIAARGGLNAWRAVNTLSWSGKMDAGGNNRPPIVGLPGQPRRGPVRANPKSGPATPATPAPVTQTDEQVQLPFRLEMERPRKSRLEIDFNGETAVQVYNGSQGWKLRPFLNRHEVENFSKDELQAFDVQADLDGALVDYAGKGTRIEVEGMEPIEGQPAYKLKLTLKNNHIVHEWVDAKTFLEVRIEGTPRRLDKKYHPVWISLRDYRSVNGLMIPHLIETSVEGVKRTEKIQIEKVTVNPRLDESRFAKPT